MKKIILLCSVAFALASCCRTKIDVQAHRGGMGLMPENTLAAMINAVDLGVNTLEMDLAVTSDGKVILSHDLYFHSRYATRPDGTSIEKKDPKEYIWTMPYDSVLKYDVGMKANKDWPEKKCMPAVKQLFSEVIAGVENYTKEKGLKPMKYNIEIKSSAAEGEGVNWLEYTQFVHICAAELQACGLGDRLIIQSFDTRALNYLHEKYPEFILSYLTGAKDVDFDKFMPLLNCTPEWLSPNFKAVTPEFLAEAAKRGMKVVTWTVDEPEDLQRMVDLNVDAIITNYPDRLIKILKEKK